MMKMSHIPTLLSNFPLGIQIRFEYNLEKWRNKIGIPLKFNLNINKNYTNTRTAQESDTTNGFQNNDSNNTLNLKQILLQCKPDGSELIATYSKNETFSMFERTRLIDIIVNYYLKHKLTFNLYTSYDIENAIIALFPSERLDLYRTGIEGKIYTKYIASKELYQQKLIDDGINDKTIENNENCSTDCNGDQRLNQKDIANNCSTNTDSVLPPNE